jgi:hypothetical protein
MGNRKHYMKILYPQGVFHPVLYPERLLCCLAFRTVPVSATVVAGTFATTTIATRYVPAQSLRAAFLQRIKRSYDKAIGMVSFNVLF